MGARSAALNGTALATLLRRDAVDLPQLRVGAGECSGYAIRLGPPTGESRFQDLIDGRDKHELQRPPQVGGDLVDVLLVELGRDHDPDPVALSRQRLLLEAT